jgi:hypothetical protein
VCVGGGGASPCLSTALHVARDEAMVWTMMGAKDLSFLQALGSPV